jgi:predicted DNA-binding ribbon-helix-helix protein
MSKTAESRLAMQDKAAPRKRSLTINGRKTSITLEEGFWQALRRIAEDRKSNISAIVREVRSTNPVNPSSAVRVFVLTYYLQWFDGKQRPPA